uniref:hypothetical protein n=1 Tax=Clostridium cuniculi TaxID=2548455 RepID=UPI00195B8452
VRVADSLKNKLVEVQAKGMNALQPKKDDKALNKTNEDQVEEGTELTIVHLNDRKKAVFKLVADYAVSKTGNSIAFKTSRKNSDSLVKASVIRFNSITHTADTLLKGFNDVKSLTWDEAGKQLAFVAERDSAVKALQKFYKLYYYHAGDDSAKMIVARNTKGML